MEPKRSELVRFLMHLEDLCFSIIGAFALGHWLHSCSAGVFVFCFFSVMRPAGWK